MFDSVLIRFPVSIVEGMSHSRYRYKFIIPIPNWFDLKVGLPITAGSYYGSPTGPLNNLTVIDCSEGFSMRLPAEVRSCIATVLTHSGHLHMYFSYDPRLHTYYGDTFKVLNDNAFACGGGQTYHIKNDCPISAIPDALFDLLMSAQESRNASPPVAIHRKIYDVFMSVPDSWFYDQYEYFRLIRVLRNTDIDSRVQHATLKRVWLDRFGYYDNQKAMSDMNLDIISYEDRRYKLGTLKRYLADMHPALHGRINEVKPPLRLAFRDGEMTKLSDIKEVMPSMTATKLVEIDRRYVSKRKQMCRYCKKPHIKGCCKRYDRKARSMCIFVCNIQLV